MTFSAKVACNRVVDVVVEAMVVVVGGCVVEVTVVCVGRTAVVLVDVVVRATRCVVVVVLMVEVVVYDVVVS